MEKLLGDARLNERQHVMFYLDLDNFKIVNDQCGHVAGGKVLKLLSEGFKNTCAKMIVSAASAVMNSVFCWLIAM